MGNYKFKLSDMIRPNAWFHKKHKETACTDSNQKKTDTPSPSKSSLALALALPLPLPNQCPNNTTINEQQPHLSDPRKSYRFTHSQLINPVQPPRKSSRRRRSVKKKRTNNRDTPEEQYPNSCLDQTCSSDLDSMLNEYGSEPDTFDAMLSSSSSCKCRVNDSNDIEFCHRVPELAPIITNYPNYQKIKFQRTSSPGFKMRTNSPRIANRRVQGGRKSSVGGSHVYASFAVVKSSKDPRRDFMESMVEMIVENNIMGSSKDLEQLLACYLSLNSDEYHDIIISVFKQIWFHFIHPQTKSFS